MQYEILSVDRSAFSARFIDLQAIIRVPSVFHPWLIFRILITYLDNLRTAPRNRTLAYSGLPSGGTRE